MKPEGPQLTGFYDHCIEFKYISSLAVECVTYIFWCNIIKTVKTSGNFNYKCNVYMMLNTTKNMTEICLHNSIEIELEISVNKIKVK